jgi:putative peptidoglycan lipid II flippase
VTPAARNPGRRTGTGLLGAAALIAALTLMSRVAGVARTFVFSGTVGQTCTGTAYSAANQVPNVLFEVVAGGALAGAVVPVIAGLLAAGRREDADRTASALLTWAVLGLTPLAVGLAALAAPLGGLLLRGEAVTDCGEAVTALASRMLAVFAPQIVLYGVGIVATGVLQAHHRFAGPALAPLGSSVTVIAAYLAYATVAGRTGGAPGPGAELVLSAGTTLGVAALSLPLLIPVLASGVRLRPTLRLPPLVGRRIRSLALAGVVSLLAQQAAVLTTLLLGTWVGGEGALVVVQYAQAVYLLPYAVLAVPIATAAFPRLSEHAGAGRSEEFASVAARTTRSVITASLLGTAVLAAAAPAVQALFTALDVGATSGALDALGEALTWFAAGLVGWGLVAHVSRALYALGGQRGAAAATATGWAAAAAGSVAAATGLRAAGAAPERAAVVGIGVGTTAGMLLAGALLLLALRTASGPRAVDGTGRALAVGGSAALAGTLLARGLTSPPGGAPAAAAVAVAAGTVAAAAFTGLLAAAAWARSPGRGSSTDRPPAGGGPRVALVLATSGGGVGRHVAALARSLHGAGLPVRVAGPRATEKAFDLAATGAAFVPVEIADRPRPPDDARALLRLRALAAEVDAVHAHGLRAGALAVLAARSLRRRPRAVVTLHNALVGGRRVTTVGGLLARIVARGADTVLVVSPDLGDLMRALGATRVERALVPAPRRTGGVPADPASTRAALRTPAGTHLLVTVARLAPQKGLPLLLDAVGALAARGLPVRAVIAGDGPLADELAGEASRRNLPVDLLGRRDDVEALLAAADVVVIPSVWEGQPLIVQEALRIPAAIVATDVGGTGEVTGDGAVLVPPGRPEALADAVAALLTRPGERAGLLERAAARALTLPTDDDAARQVVEACRGR